MKGIFKNGGDALLSNAEKAKLQTTLQERQHKLIDRVEKSNHMELAFPQESLGELSSYDNHPGDEGTALYDRQRENALNEHVEGELEEINEALHALNENTYGICQVCGEAIPVERLEAVPTTKYCIKHADVDTFVQTERPIEEEMYDGAFKNRFKDEVEYDAEDAWQDVERYGTSSTNPSTTWEDYVNPSGEDSEELSAVDAVEDMLYADINGSYEGSEELRKNEELTD